MDSLPFFLYLFYLFLFLLYLFPAGSQRSLCRLRGQPTLPVLRLLRMLLQRSQVSCVVLCVCWWHVLDVAACYFVMQQWRGGLCWQQRLGLECCLCAWWWSCDIVGAIVALLPPPPPPHHHHHAPPHPTTPTHCRCRRCCSPRISQQRATNGCRVAQRQAHCSV